jgi:hypothetical protein
MSSRTRSLELEKWAEVQGDLSDRMSRTSDRMRTSRTQLHA